MMKMKVISSLIPPGNFFGKEENLLGNRKCDALVQLCVYNSHSQDKKRSKSFD